jgi:hypothetical protein
MKKWLRRVRGAIGVGITWGVVWGVVGGVLEAVFGLPPGSSGPGIVFQEFVRGFAALATFGFLGSGVFSIALGLGGRRRSFAEMSLPRFAGWGALAGLIVGLVLAVGTGVLTPGALTIGVGVMALLGAGSAAGSLALARVADDRELLEAGEAVAEVGLTTEESGALLGR